jgi:hypothetical protein
MEVPFGEGLMLFVEAGMALLLLMGAHFLLVLHAGILIREQYWGLPSNGTETAVSFRPFSHRL